MPSKLLTEKLEQIEAAIAGDPALSKKVSALLDSSALYLCASKQWKILDRLRWPDDLQDELMAGDEHVISRVLAYALEREPELKRYMLGPVGMPPFLTPQKRNPKDNIGFDGISLTHLCQLQNYDTFTRPIQVDGLALAGSVNTVSGGTKTNKSKLINQLIVSALTGGKFLDFPVKAGRVALLDGELGADQIHARLLRTIDAMGGMPDDAYDRLDVYALRGRSYLDYQNAVAEICNFPKGHYKYIVIDPLYTSYPPRFSENDNSGMAKLYRRLIQFATATEAAIFVIHHFSKGEQSYKKISDLGAGAGAIARASDAHLVLREHSEPGCVVLDGVVRDFPPIKPRVLRFDFPLYVPAPELDPAELKGSRKPKDRLVPEKPKAIPTDEFVTRFISAEPIALARIQAVAKTEGVAPTTASQRVKEAVATGKVFRWGSGSNSRYATIPEPATLPA